MSVHHPDCIYRSNCAALKSIKNLETFEFRFSTEGYRSNDQTYGKILLNDVNEQPLSAADHRKGILRYGPGMSPNKLRDTLPS
jgi:hypothetical protein